MSESDRPTLPPLSDVIPLDKNVPCPECGGFLFFDWGLKLLNTAYKSVTPRFDGAAATENVLVCASCHHPVAQIGNDYYDAIDFVPKDRIEKLIREGQARAQPTPIAAMDP